ncbi:MAG: class II aldolase/adducin family protein [Cyanobacteriota bacterium]|nr:class II aldolase/adducin family protein [Cyanobacteriota bacterium]
MHHLLEEASALCQVITAIHQRGWCDGTGGNFSSVLLDEPLALLMAPSGVDKRSLTPAELIIVDGGGTVIGGSGQASAETLVHLTIITTTHARAVLHTHSQAATLLSRLHPPPNSCLHLQPNAGESLWWEGEPSATGLLGHLRIGHLEMLKGLEGIGTHSTTISIPILANSQDMRELSEFARPHLVKAPYGILIAGHGLYSWGDSLVQARRHLEILEFLLEQHWRQLSLDLRLIRHGVT